MKLYEIEFPLENLNLEEVESALLEIGASSMTFLDGGDEPVLEPKPGEVRLWSDTLVRALFEESQDPARNWNTSRRARAAHHCVRAHPAGGGTRMGACVARRLEIDAIWTAAVGVPDGRRCARANPRAVVVRLDPGLAFGTGTHPTTALCLRILDALRCPRLGDRLWMRLRHLGIAALKLGAARVTAVDLDPQALIATRENAIRNGVSSQIETQAVPAALQAADCVVANILAGPLIELAPLLTDACRPKGDLLLSGLLETQACAVKAAYSSAFDMVQVIGRDDWCCIHARRAA